MIKILRKPLGESIDNLEQLSQGHIDVDICKSDNSNELGNLNNNIVKFAQRSKLAADEIVTFAQTCLNLAKGAGFHRAGRF